jgi:hypothetical protein
MLQIKVLKSVKILKYLEQNLNSCVYNSIKQQRNKKQLK